MPRAPFPGKPQRHRTTAADAGHHGLDHADGERRGHRRINRVASPPEHLQSGARGLGMRGCHHPPPGNHPLIRPRRRLSHHRRNHGGAEHCGYYCASTQNMA